MKILVVGSGGREHALVWKLGRERSVASVLCAPGNAGIARLARTVPVDAGDVDGLLDLAIREAVDLTVVGPELPLDRGHRGSLFVTRAADLRSIRAPPPSSNAARSSPRTSWRARHPDGAVSRVRPRSEARAVLAAASSGYPVVVKADGLAAGKGVVVADDRAAADAAMAAAMDERQFGDAGDRARARGVSDRPGGFVLRDLRRPARRAGWHRRRITSASSTTTRARTPAAWARSRRARWSTRR